MPDMFSPSAVMRNPEGIVRVIEVTLPQISGWMMYQYQGLPDHLMQHIRDLDLLRKGFAPLYDEMQEGDSLWLCRSDKIGPLYGHEGIALVRDRRVIIYIRMVQY